MKNADTGPTTGLFETQARRVCCAFGFLPFRERLLRKFDARHFLYPRLLDSRHSPDATAEGVCASGTAIPRRPATAPHTLAADGESHASGRQYRVALAGGTKSALSRPGLPPLFQAARATTPDECRVRSDCRCRQRVCPDQSSRHCQCHRGDGYAQRSPPLQGHPGGQRPRYRHRAAAYRSD